MSKIDCLVNRLVTFRCCDTMLMGQFIVMYVCFPFFFLPQQSKTGKCGLSNNRGVWRLLFCSVLFCVDGREASQLTQGTNSWCFGVYTSVRATRQEECRGRINKKFGLPVHRFPLDVFFF